MSVLKFTCGILLAILANIACIYSENIVRHECGAQATFYKVASNYAMNDADNMTKTTNDGYMGCIDHCIEYPMCKAFNYKSVVNDIGICELLHKDRTTNPKDVVSRTGWNYCDTGLFSSQIGQLCRSFTYNPCYPCLCIDSCYSNVGYTCNCTAASPSLPNIYMSFEKTVDGDSTKIPYDRGEDMNGNSKVIMKNGANIGTSGGRPGNVLRMTGTNAGADAGYFQHHRINNPGNGNFSISFWLQVLSPHSAVQTVFRTGSTSWDTGVSLRLQNSATTIIARLITDEKDLYTGNINIYDTLTTWSHFVINANYEGSLFEVYVNGRLIARDTTFSSCTASMTNNPNLIFGGAASTSNDYWGMQIDDFAVWNGRLLTSDEIVYTMNKGFVQDTE